MGPYNVNLAHVALGKKARKNRKIGKVTVCKEEDEYITASSDDVSP
jgi:phosphoribosylaminoimidazole carboxylase (NCAIR synthetase)